MTGNSRKQLKSGFAAASLAMALMYGGAVMAAEPEATATPLSDDGAPPVTVDNDRQTSANDNNSLTKTWTIEARPLVHPGVIGGLAGMALLLSAYAGRHRTKGTVLRAGTALALTGALINPEILEEERARLPTEVAVVIDKSASQNLDDRAGQTEAAYQSLYEKLSAMDGINIRTINVGDDQEKAAGGTKIFTTLDTALSDVPRDRLGAVIVLTDGQVHDVPQSARDLVGADVPLHVLVSGKEQETDRRIVIETAPEFGLVGKKQTISFHVADEGRDHNAAEKVRVVLRNGTEELGEKMVTPGETVEMDVEITHSGKNIFELETESLADELTTLNNRIVTTVEGVRESLNVLLVSGRPHAGMRSLRALLKSDPDTDLVHFTVMRPPEKEDYAPLRDRSLIPMPTHEIFHDKLEEFDLVVFDRYEYRALLPVTYFNNLARYTKNGGALMVINGEEYNGVTSIYQTPLQSILSAAPAGNAAGTPVPYRPQITDAGERHPVTRGLGNDQYSVDGGERNWGSWYHIANSKASRGHTVMEGREQKPLLVLDRQEKGRVAMLQSGNAWLWARDYGQGGPYADMVRRTVQWLIKNPDMEEEALRLVPADDGRITVERQTMSDMSAPVHITTPSGDRLTVTPEETGAGLWQASFEADEYGIYRAEQQDGANYRAVLNRGLSHPAEYENPLSTTKILAPAAQETGGIIARMGRGQDAGSVPDVAAREQGSRMDASGNLGIRMSGTSVLKGMDRTSLIPGWLGMVAFMTVLACAYFREGGGVFSRKGNKAAPDKKTEKTKQQNADVRPEKMRRGL